MIFIKKFLYIIFGILFAGSLGTSFYFYRQYTALYRTLPQAAQEEAKKLVVEVGRLIILPTNEQPTIATVTDPVGLRDQPFFANAKKGDKVLIYTNAKKAILYNPTEGKIVEVAPISIGQAPTDSTNSPQANAPQDSPADQESTSTVKKK